MSHNLTIPLIISGTLMCYPTEPKEALSSAVTSSCTLFSLEMKCFKKSLNVLNTGILYFLRNIQ